MPRDTLPVGRLPAAVTGKILARAARGAKAVVVTIKDGKPRTVWGLDEYLQRRELGRKTGQERKGKRKTSVDPLGAVDLGAVAGPLDRERIYEGE